MSIWCDDMWKGHLDKIYCETPCALGSCHLDLLFKNSYYKFFSLLMSPSILSFTCCWTVSIIVIFCWTTLSNFLALETLTENVIRFFSSHWSRQVGHVTQHYEVNHVSGVCWHTLSCNAWELYFFKDYKPWEYHVQ